MITIADASNLYLLAKAMTMGELQELMEKWTAPAIEAAQELIRAYIKSNPQLEAQARADPRVSELLEGEQDATSS